MRFHLPSATDFLLVMNHGATIKQYLFSVASIAGNDGTDATRFRNDGIKGFLMPILLTNEDVKKLITPEIAVDVMRETYRSMAEGTGVTRTRSQTFGETSKEGTFVELRTSDGIIPAFRAVGMRILPDLHSWPKIGDTVRHDKVPKANKKFLAFNLIFDLDTADLQAVARRAGARLVVLDSRSLEDRPQLAPLVWGAPPPGFDVVRDFETGPSARLRVLRTGDRG